MADLQPRLARCFAIAFPELTPQEIPGVSMASLGSWDSLAGITLLSLVEEEFGVSISPDDAAAMVSFQLLLDYLSNASLKNADRKTRDRMHDHPNEDSVRDLPSKDED